MLMDCERKAVLNVGYIYMPGVCRIVMYVLLNSLSFGNIKYNF